MSNNKYLLIIKIISKLLFYQRKVFPGTDIRKNLLKMILF